MRAYEMNAMGEVFDISAPSGIKAEPKYVTHLDPAVYCERMAAVNDAFLQTQAMNVRGDRARYMEYVNPTTDVFLRVTWNPDLETFQSRYFRSEFNAMMEYVPAP